MKSVSLLTAALAGAAGVALVAGPALAQPTANWNGPYVGLNTGWSSGNTHVGSDAATTQQLTGVSAGAGPVAVPPATFATAPQDYSSSSWAGGGQIGFNHQMGHVVLGVEGDMDALGGRASQFSSYVLPGTALTTGSRVTMFRSTDPHWTSTIRGRVGWATGPMLIYATGGLALGDFRNATFYSYTPTVTAAVAAANPGAAFGPTASAGVNDSVHTGWTIGGGLEWALSPAVSVGAEYRHLDFGSPTYAFGSTAPGGTFEGARIGFTEDQLLAKVNFRFGHGIF